MCLKIYYEHPKVLYSYIMAIFQLLHNYVHICKMCFCAICAYARSRVTRSMVKLDLGNLIYYEYSRPCDARSIAFLDVKDCLNVEKLLLALPFEYGKSPCFSASQVLTVGTVDVAVLDFSIVNGAVFVG